jgi:uncharacterized spore protein YtfJ
MAEKITDIVKSLLDGMHSISHTETFVGEPTQVGSATIIPVHRIRMGFVAAAVSAGAHAERGEGRTGGRGVGGGAQVDPVAVLAIGPDGHPRLLPVEGEAEGTWQRLIREAPELISRLVHKAADRLEQVATKPAASAGELDAAAAPALDRAAEDKPVAKTEE